MLATKNDSFSLSLNKLSFELNASTLEFYQEENFFYCNLLIKSRDVPRSNFVWSGPTKALAPPVKIQFIGIELLQKMIHIAIKYDEIKNRL